MHMVVCNDRIFRLLHSLHAPPPVRLPLARAAALPHRLLTSSLAWSPAHATPPLPALRMPRHPPVRRRSPFARKKGHHRPCKSREEEESKGNSITAGDHEDFSVNWFKVCIMSRLHLYTDKIAKSSM
jgi:hypothetical protein